MDVLRLAGAPGVGKSAVAWAIARRLAADAVPTGYVDIDQLGMCYPAPVGDPHRWALKETALVRLAARFHDAGVERLVVSGVADPTGPPPANGHPTLSLWLDADERTRRVRLAPRGWERGAVDTVLAAGTDEASAAHPSWERMNTDRSTVAETVRSVVARWMSDSAEAVPPPEQPEGRGAGRIIWITGPRCAGASRVGWELARSRWAAGRRTGFVDVAQLGFAWNVQHLDGVENAAALQRLFAAAGADTVVAVAPVETAPAEVLTAFPRSDLRFFRLDADDRTRRDGARRRAAGAEGPQLAGDDLIGATADRIERIVAVGARQRATPLRAGESLVDTAGSSVQQVVERIGELSVSPPLPD